MGSLPWPQDMPSAPHSQNWGENPGIQIPSCPFSDPLPELGENSGVVLILLALISPPFFPPPPPLPGPQFSRAAPT